MKLIEDVPTVVPDGGYGGFTPSSIAKRRPEEMRRIPWLELLEMRKRAEGNQQLQDFLSSYEHGAYARETVKENPAMFVPIAIAIPAYNAYKRISGKGRSNPSLNQVTEGYRGAAEGLVESFKQLTELTRAKKYAECDKHEVETPRKCLCVDHNHSTGKIRELLYESCNQALGLFYENVETLRNAVAYLERYNDNS